MGGGGGKQNVEQKTKSDPWAGAQPYIGEGLARLQGWWDTNRTPYAGPTTAPQSPETILGQQLGTSRALAGSQYTNSGGDELSKTASGWYLNPANNPALMQKYNLGVENMMPTIDTQASKIGRYGSDTHNIYRGKALAEIANQVYAPERQLQVNSMKQAIPYAANDYRDLALLSGIGADKQGYAQSQLTAQENAWNQAQQQPIDDLKFYLNSVLGGGAMGNQGSSKQPIYGPSALSQVLGTGGALASLGLLGYNAFNNPGSTGGGLLTPGVLSSPTYLNSTPFYLQNTIGF